MYNNITQVDEYPFGFAVTLDTQRVQATLNQGVLTLKLPKSDRLKPRRIEVTVE